MTVSDWSQSIYLLTELQLVQGMLLLGERKRETERGSREGGEAGERDRYRRRGRERVDGWRVRGA